MGQRKGKLSVIIPAYNEEKMIHKTSVIIADILKQEHIDYELLFINDGSKDETWKEIEEQCNENPNISAVCFARNFGKEAAMFAGLENCTGDCAVIIDCDLQHPPLKIVEMYHLWQEGIDVIHGVKSDRGNESKIHRFFADSFYMIISKITKMNMKNASDFKLIDRKVIELLVAMPERNTFFRALSSWVGFKTATVLFEVQEREEGKSKWSFVSLTKYALSNITSFSTLPMQFVTFSGIAFLFLSIILGIRALLSYIVNDVTNELLIVISAQACIGSIVMIGIGIVGYYIAKIYDEVKGRPRYIVQEKKNISNIKQ